MGAIIMLTNGLGLANAGFLAVGRWLGAICMGLMVVIILAQVFFRYVIGTALAWPEEASRFFMLWATGLMAATAFRRGGFVSIDMLARLMPRQAVSALALAILSMTLAVLWVAVQIGWSEVTGLGGRFSTDSLNVPTSLDLSTWKKVPRGWMMASMLVGCTLLFLVNVELMLRNLVGLLGGHERLRDIPETVVLGAE